MSQGDESFRGCPHDIHGNYGECQLCLQTKIQHINPGEFCPDMSRNQFVRDPKPAESVGDGFNLVRSMATGEVLSGLLGPAERSALKKFIDASDARINELERQLAELREMNYAQSAQLRDDRTERDKLKSRAEALRGALEFYAGKRDGKWIQHACDSWSGLTSAFDWDGETQDEPWEVASNALKADDEAAI